jgi:hypothetical protein
VPVIVKQLQVAQLERVFGGTAEKPKKKQEDQPDYSVAMVERNLANPLLSGWPLHGRHVSFQFKAKGGGLHNVQLLESDKHPTQGSAFITAGLMDPHQHIVGIHQMSAGGFAKAEACAQGVVKRYDKSGPRPYSKIMGPSSSGFAYEVNKECHLGFEKQFSKTRDWQYDYWQRPGHRF